MPEALWVPTKEEAALIRAMAEKECARGGLVLEPGIRFNTEDGRQSMNVLLVDITPEWATSDLADHATWADFRRGVELTPTGEATVDFYCSSRGEYGQLESNVVVHYAAGRITAIYGTLRAEALYDAEAAHA